MKKQQILLILLGMTTIATAQKKQQVAFIADAHIQSVLPPNSDALPQAFYNEETNQYHFIRSLDAQMESTRLFNENYFALLATLEQLAAQNVHLVVLDGDYSDDGQQMNIDEVQRILAHYSQKYGMRFFMTNGNHEAVNRFDKEAGKSDFMDQKGNEIGVYSHDSLLKNPNDLVYEGLREKGYETLFSSFATFGLQPQPQDLFYTTPFHTFDYENYQYNASDFSLDQRTYLLNDIRFPDFTYLVEPEKDVWLLGIDGNMYAQTEAGSFKNISDGYRFLDQRAYLFSWLKQVASEAKKRNKTLLVFSHYPVLDFNNGLSDELKELLGNNAFQLSRVPENDLQQLFLETGIALHFAGHMHINQHGFISNGQHKLWNIQIPSLAAFPPGYKLVTVSKNEIKVETKPLKDVPDYQTFFKDYAKSGTSEKYAEALTTENYYDFAKMHLKYLSAHRFLKDDFNDSKWSVYKTTPLHTFVAQKDQLSADSQKELQTLQFTDLMFDLYLVRNGNDLGIKELSKKRLHLYHEWNSLIKQQTTPPNDLERLVVLLQNMIDKSINTEKLVLKRGRVGFSLDN